MNEFAASNGLLVTERAGHLVVRHANASPLIAAGNVGIALKEYSDHLRAEAQAEADERFGRWRWPENRDIYVTAEHVGFVTVVDERDPANPGTWERYWRDAKTEKDRAGVAYFDAHPEPRPWHEAVEGEAWALSIGDDAEKAWMAEGDGPRFWRGGHSIDRLSGSITAGRRIWPEVSS